MAALTGASAASARAAGTSVLLPGIWSSTTIVWDQGGDYKDHDWDKDHDSDKDHDKRKHHEGDDAPSPVPEPSTLLSFGAALVIGGGVFLLRATTQCKEQESNFLSPMKSGFFSEEGAWLAVPPKHREWFRRFQPALDLELARRQALF